MRRTLSFLAALAGLLATHSAVAQTVTVQRAVGEGVLENEHGRRAQFLLDVRKVIKTEGGVARSYTEGPVKFRLPNREEGTIIYIVSERMREMLLNEDKNKAAIYGYGVLTVVTATTSRRYEGRMKVYAFDNREPDGPGEPDGFAIRFEVARSDRVFEYRGHVVRGDIKISERTRSVQ